MIAAFGVCAGGLLAGCGGSGAGPSGGIPQGSVATVGSAVITTASLNHWLSVSAHSQAAQAAPPSPVPPLDPPAFAACVAFHERTDPPPAKGQVKPTPPALKAECVQTYDAARDQAMSFLIAADWFQGEAADEGLTITPAEVATALKTTEAQSFPTPAKLQQFLTQSGQNNADLLFRTRIDALDGKIQEKVAGAVSTTVTPAEIASYYKANPGEFTTPASRDIRFVRLKTAGQAAHVLGLLKGGANLAAIAAKYSTDPTTRKQGGALRGVTSSETTLAARAQIFRAPLNRLVGPVKTPFGYELFRVTKITPSGKQTLAQATATIKQDVAAERRQAALTAFSQKFEAKWHSQTTCAPGYLVSDCKNGPPATTAPTTAPQGPPAGG